ncbi:MAG: YceD family protein [Acidimicrobiales bacterium]
MSTPPFIVNLAALRVTPGTRHHLVRSGPLSGLAITSSAVPAGAPVTVDADLEIVDGGVVVTGTVSGPWVGECRRCLRPVSGQLAATVREVYERAPRSHGDEHGDEIDTYPLTGDVVDLAPLARDAVFLELPLAPLCRDDCAGLCPTCGADLAEGPCGCAPTTGHAGWSALDRLRSPDAMGADST